jgi:hypothetical protein
MAFRDKRQIIAAVGVSSVLALALIVAAVAYLPNQQATGISTSILTSVTTSTSVVTATSTTTVASATTPPVQNYTSATVPPDPSLAVNPIQGLLQTSTNASVIAQSLASQLNELPITLVSQQLPTCTGNSILCTQSTYIYKTPTGSNITVDMIQGKFYELDYITQDYYTLTGGSTASVTASAFNVTKADGEVQQIVNKAFGVPLANLTEVDQLSPYLSATDYVVQWGEGFQGMPIANSGVVYFEFYPPASQLVRMIITEGSGWYSIPSNFPLDVQPTVALDSVVGYATYTLHMNSISYSDISLQIIQERMYYTVTLSNYAHTYLFVVNPRTGEIGFPQS